MTELTPEQRAAIEEMSRLLYHENHKLAVRAAMALIASQAAALAALTQQIGGVQGALADAGDVFCSREDGDYGASVRQVVEERDASRAALAERADRIAAFDFQPEPHTEGKWDKWTILAIRILSFGERDDVADGLDAEMAALKRLVAERDAEIAKLKGELGELLKHLREHADNAYVKGCQLSKRSECLGADAKMKNGTFGRKELLAHRECEREFGTHFGIYKVLSQARGGG